jgi:hypothetical protein
MTNTLIFQGHIDDTFACTGRGIDVDHDNCASGTPITMLVSGTGGRMLVIGQYCAGDYSGGWHIAVAPYDPDDMDDETVHIPDWPISISPSSQHYSPMLCVTAPDDVSVVLL